MAGFEQRRFGFQPLSIPLVDKASKVNGSDDRGDGRRDKQDRQSGAGQRDGGVAAQEELGASARVAPRLGGVKHQVQHRVIDKKQK